MKAAIAVQILCGMGVWAAQAPAHAVDAAAEPAAALQPAAPSAPQAPPSHLPLRSFGRVRHGALTGLGVREGACELELGFLLGGAPAAFVAVPPAAVHAAHATRARRLGVGLWAVGLSLLVGDLVYALAAGDRIDYAGGTGAVFYSLLGGSVLAGVLAQDRLGQADAELAEATHLWNQRAFDEARAAAP